MERINKIKEIVRKFPDFVSKKSLNFGTYKNILKHLLAGLIIAGVFSISLYAFATPPDAPYSAGQTLNPNCSPDPADINYKENCSLLTSGLQPDGDITTTGVGNFGNVEQGGSVKLGYFGLALATGSGGTVAEDGFKFAIWGDTGDLITNGNVTAAGLTVPSILLNNSSQAGYGSAIYLQRGGVTEWYQQIDSLTGEGDAPNNQLDFDNASGTAVLTLLQNGNVGIGIASPSQKLDVAGAINLSGISAPSVSSLSAGIIYFDSESGKFKVSENGGDYIDLVGAGAPNGWTENISTTITSDSAAITISATNGGLGANRVDIPGSPSFSSCSGGTFGSAGGPYSFVGYFNGYPYYVANDYSLYVGDNGYTLTNGSPTNPGSTISNGNNTVSGSGYYYNNSGDWCNYSSGAGYKLPVNDGSSGQFLSTDGYGSSYWGGISDFTLSAGSDNDLQIKSGNGFGSISPNNGYLTWNGTGYEWNTLSIEESDPVFSNSGLGSIGGSAPGLLSNNGSGYELVSASQGYLYYNGSGYEWNSITIPYSNGSFGDLQTSDGGGNFSNISPSQGYLYYNGSGYEWGVPSSSSGESGNIQTSDGSGNFSNISPSSGYLYYDNGSYSWVSISVTPGGSSNDLQYNNGNGGFGSVSPSSGYLYWNGDSYNFQGVSAGNSNDLQVANESGGFSGVSPSTGYLYYDNGSYGWSTPSGFDAGSSVTDGTNTVAVADGSYAINATGEVRATLTGGLNSPFSSYGVSNAYGNSGQYYAVNTTNNDAGWVWEIEDGSNPNAFNFGSTTGLGYGMAFNYPTSNAAFVFGTDGSFHTISGTNSVVLSDSTYAINATGILNINTFSSDPPLSSSGSGSIYFNGTKFRISENGGDYADLVGGGGDSVWSRNESGVVSFQNSGDIIQIGQNESSSPLSGTRLDLGGGNSTVTMLINNTNGDYMGLGHDLSVNTPGWEFDLFAPATNAAGAISFGKLGSDGTTYTQWMNISDAGLKIGLNTELPYTLPTQDSPGNSGYVLTTDGSGTVSWQAPSSGGPAWSEVTTSPILSYATPSAIAVAASASDGGLGANRIDIAGTPYIGSCSGNISGASGTYIFTGYINGHPYYTYSSYYLYWYSGFGYTISTSITSPDYYAVSNGQDTVSGNSNYYNSNTGESCYYSSGAGYVIPINDGTSSQVLTTDGLGHTSWQTPITPSNGASSSGSYQVQLSDGGGNFTAVSGQGTGCLYGDGGGGYNWVDCGNSGGGSDTYYNTYYDTYYTNFPGGSPGDLQYNYDGNSFGGISPSNGFLHYNSDSNTYEWTTPSGASSSPSDSANYVQISDGYGGFSYDSSVSIGSSGTLNASYFAGDGSNLTNINATNWNGYSMPSPSGDNCLAYDSMSGTLTWAACAAGEFTESDPVFTGSGLSSISGTAPGVLINSGSSYELINSVNDYEADPYFTNWYNSGLTNLNSLTINGITEITSGHGLDISPAIFTSVENETLSAVFINPGFTDNIGGATKLAMDVYGSVRFHSVNTDTAESGGTVKVTSDGLLFNGDASSLRYKTNVQPLAEDWKNILLTQPKSFNYKNSGAAGIGYIAEDFDALGLKALVNYDKEGRPDSIKYDRIALFDTEILKQQQLDINDIKQKLGLSVDNLAINPAGSVGSGGVSGLTDQSVKASLANLGVTLTDGIASLKQIFADNVTTKTATMDGLEMIDKATGEKYCTWIENGEWKKEKGDCSKISTAASASGPSGAASVTQELKQTVQELQQQVQDQKQQVEQIQQQQQEQTQAQASASALTILSIKNNPDLLVNIGTERANLALPATVSCTLSDGSLQNISVNWQEGTPTYDLNTEGTYQFTGILVLPENVDNSGNLQSSINVIVQQSAPEQPAGLLHRIWELLNSKADIQKEPAGLVNGVAGFVKTANVIDGIKNSVNPITSRASDLVKNIYDGIPIMEKSMAGLLNSAFEFVEKAPASMVNSIDKILK